MRALVLMAALAACGSGSTSDPLAPRVRVAEGALRAANRALGFSTAFISTGVVNTNTDPATIASALYQRFKAETGTCAQATPTDNMVTVDLGKGCTLATANFVVGGTATVTVNQPMGMPLDVHIELDLTVDGTAVTGTIDCNTTDGNVYTYNIQVSADGTTASIPFISAGIAGGGAQLNGMGTFSGCNTTSTVTLDALHQGFASAFPDDGTVRMQDTNVDFTLAFDSTTGGSGEATLTENGQSQARTVTLPKAGNACPSR